LAVEAVEQRLLSTTELLAAQAVVVFTKESVAQEQPIKVLRAGQVKILINIRKAVAVVLEQLDRHQHLAQVILEQVVLVCKLQHFQHQL
tara:strand:- start:249 stop:515 length:267 start_codon:yes stop_codon:yes gene_type:complete